MEGGGVSNGGMLYHEVQESKLCAVHCVNTVLQGPFFSEFDLAALASDLDLSERQMMLGTATGDFLPDQSHNVSLDGDFSIQVLQKALEVWDLQVIPLNSPVAEPAQIDPETENAFICHLQDHWFCIRKVNGEWYNFDSLYAAPEHLSKFYLSAYLDSLKGSGWSIFLVRGNFPRECPITTNEASNYGQWLSPEDAERITKSCNLPPRTRPGAGQSQQFSDPHLQYGEAEMLLDDEDEDLKAAIAASLMDSGTTSRTDDDTPGKEDEDSYSESEDLRAAIAASLMDSGGLTKTEDYASQTVNKGRNSKGDEMKAGIETSLMDSEVTPKTEEYTSGKENKDSNSEKEQLKGSIESKSETTNTSERKNNESNS